MKHLIADIHMPGNQPPLEAAGVVDPRLNEWGRATLGFAMQEEGLDVRYSRGKNAYDVEEGSANLSVPTFSESENGRYEVRLTQEEVAIDSVKAVRNITGRLYLPGRQELNDPVLRDLTTDKAETNRVLTTVGLAKEWAPFNGERGLLTAVDAITGDGIVLKPRRGKQGDGIILATKNDIPALIENGQIVEDDMIVEERLNMNVPFAVRGINEEEQGKIEVANREGRAKELRAYYFGRNKGGDPQLHFVMRAGNDKHTDRLHHDDWIFIEQESVPQELFDSTVAVADAFRKDSGVNEAHIAVDWAATRKGRETRWLPMEVNGNEPQLVYEKDHQPTARLHAKLLAQQLRRVAEAGSTV